MGYKHMRKLTRAALLLTLTASVSAYAEGWQAGPTLPASNHFGGAEIVGDDLYLLGGVVDGALASDQNFLRLDDASGSWQVVAPNPAQRQYVGTATLNGEFVAFGGVSFAVPNALTRVDAYSPATNSWRQLASLPSTVVGADGGEHNGRLYVFDGEFVFAYDVDNDAWTVVSTMPTQTFGRLSVAYHEGAFYTFGGYLSQPGQVSSDQVDRYDPETNTWTSLAPMPTARHLHSTAVLHGRVHVVGGSYQAEAVHEVYDIASNTWSTAADVPQPVLGAAAAAKAGKLWLLGGWYETVRLDNVQIYDPVVHGAYKNAWEACGFSLPFSHITLAGGGAIDVDLVDGSTIEVGGARPDRSYSRDTTTVDGQCACERQWDGVSDLNLIFRHGASGVMTGRLLDGTPFDAVGCD